MSKKSIYWYFLLGILKSSEGGGDVRLVQYLFCCCCFFVCVFLNPRLGPSSCCRQNSEYPTLDPGPHDFLNDKISNTNKLHCFVLLRNICASVVYKWNAK